MAIAFKLAFATTLLTAVAANAETQLDEANPIDSAPVVRDADADLRPPGQTMSSEPRVVHRAPISRLATTERWGGGLRLTGLSGIGALPGVNYGAELAGLVRRDEFFAELGLSQWKPRETFVVTETPEHVELGLDIWSLRAGWASMQMPLRAWGVLEVGEIAGAAGMQGVVTRMVMGNTPEARQWRAAGGGLGIAWPMSKLVRLTGTMEVVVPLNRERLMLDRGEAYTPDFLAARYSLGLEVGWR